MIEDIQIRNEACFDSDGQALEGLKPVNFVYGSNGTGKTTISRVIADCDCYSECTLNWKNQNPLEVYAYNRDFVSKNFNPDSRLKGIFTLGEKDEETIQRIAAKKEEIENLEKDIANRSKTLQGDDGNGGKVGDLIKRHSEFEAICWDAKSRFDPYFKGAFSGVRGSQAKFKDKLIEEARKPDGDLAELDELKAKAETVFASDLTKEHTIPPIMYDDLLGLEKSAVLEKVIVGKDDVDIAAMISKLGNSDWVKQGLGYFETSKPDCPFCQQSTEDSFAASLDDYFDDVYLQDINDIATLASHYEAESDAVLKRLRAIIEASPKYMDCDRFEAEVNGLASTIGNNLGLIEQKRKEPSRIIQLESLQDYLENIANSVSAANSKVVDHNSTVDNINEEKSNLCDEIWRCVVDDTKTSYQAFDKDRSSLEAAIESLQTQIKEKEASKAEKDAELIELEQDITSIQPTIDSINRLLQSFGFSGFSLAKADKESFYKIVRPNGTDAQQTLSEGERTFLTFLYFYHLLKGSISESGTTTDRVVIIDDPISSLDSDILFIVGSLIKGVIHDLRDGKGHIKQILVLTHNIYFHREITFDNKRSAGSAFKDETFWIIKKRDKCSVVESHAKNPVSTSYELLWDEVKDANRSPMTIQNALRRILENYFKILGNIDNDAIVNMFDGDERLVCRSLFSWVNAGSHYANDDLYVACDAESIEKYLDVFKMIFEKSGHIAHYEMMIGTPEAA